MIVFLLKTSFSLVFILVFYKLIIERESFFAANRMYLLLGLLFAFILPFISLPKFINNQGIVDTLIVQSHINRKTNALVPDNKTQESVSFNTETIIKNKTDN